MARKPDPEARGKLLQAARTTFAEVGVDAARIEDVTRRAGLSKGAFYLHFESKEAAFEELVTSFFAVMGELSAERHEAAQELAQRVSVPTPEDWQYGTPRLRAWAELDHAWTVKTLRAMWRHRDVLRCVLEQGSGQRGHLVERLVALTREGLTRQLEAAARDCGMRSDVDHDLVSELLIGLYLQLGRRMVRAPTRPDFDAWARTVNTLIVEGIAPRGPSAAALLQPDPSVNQEAS